MPNPINKNFDPNAARELWLQKFKQGFNGQAAAVPAPQPSPMAPEEDQEGLMKKIKLDALRKMMMGG